ncbi:hypothetical protein [Adhaeribacter soli]|uniref:DUF6311 domain-containing protein n=1 Tax=Adhaeribacter soli TaxID=2607655 RepID=A0A5N1IUZ9_9BACT|nr:hypothetical protein [Adhaeribacter soli]KAA9331870.1 hypothetical protein F0P94_13815 [Adhaeribacter soli]
MKNRKALLLLIPATLLLLYFLFGNILLHPGQYLFGDIEDGTKNYYTAAYFIKYDQGVWFTGMNYPFGEHITYTDNQPLFSVLLNFIERHITPVSGHTIAIFNNLMLWGMVACAFFLYLILTELKLPPWYALAIAIIIAFLSPQLFRIRAHYALGYTFIIPMAWYLILKIFRQPRKIKWYLIYALAGLLVTLIHPYYALINLLLLLSYVLVYYLQEKKKQKLNYRLLIGIVTAVLVPLLFFQVYMHLTDPVTDRPDTPYGFTAYRTSFKALFFPLEAPLLKYWQAVFGSKEVIWEGYAYVGQTAFIVLLLTLAKFFKYARRKRWKLIFRPVLPAPLRVGLWASVLVLLFALAIPIKWGLQGALDLIPPLKQFRSIGRFAWIFYYIFSVYTAYYLYQVFRNLRFRQKPGLAFTFTGILVAFWAFEGLNNTYQKALSIKKLKVAEAFMGEQGNYTALLNSLNLPAANFQAILPLPYFNVGSEKVSIFRNAEVANEAMKASLNTGLPITTVLLSRTSVSQSLMQLQLLSSPFIPKTILPKYASRKPLLLMVTPDSLLPAEAALVKKARFITQKERIALYQLPLDSLQAAANTIPPLLDGLQKKGNYYVSNQNGAIIRRAFTDGEQQEGLYQTGTLALDQKKTIIIDTLINLPASQAYELTAWAYAMAKNLPTLTVTLTNPDGTLIQESEMRFTSTETMNNWLMGEHTFKVPAGRTQLRITSKSRQALVDDILVRPLNTDVYFYGFPKSILIKNNRPASY